MNSENRTSLIENDSNEKYINKKQVRNVEYFIVILGATNIIFLLYILVIGKQLDWLIILMLAFLTYAPAFIANAGMTIAGTMGKNNRPLDFEKKFIDGEPIFGEGKTIKGFFGGIIIGIIFSPLLLPLHILAQAIAVAEMGIMVNGSPLYYLTMQLVDYQEFTRILSVYPPNLLLLHVPRIVLLSIAAPVGDLFGSFIKRRFKRPRGSQFPVIDQIDFILVSFLFTFLIFPLELYYYILLIIFTPLVTLFANFIAYKLGRKKVPW